MGSMILFIIIFPIICMITTYLTPSNTRQIEVIHPANTPSEPEKPQRSIYYSVGHEFERKYGKKNLTVKQVCMRDSGPRETNVLREFPDGTKLCSYGSHPTLVGNLENLLKTGTPKEIDDFNDGRLAYVEEKGKETLTIMDNSSVLEKGTKQVEALRQGYDEIATHKSPELQWKKEFDEI